ncbi:hypothetical protein ACHAXT_006052 [Thalassiosira profunda]
MDIFADDGQDDGPGADAAAAHLAQFARTWGIDVDVVPPSRWDASGDYPPFYGRMMLGLQEKILRLVADLVNERRRGVGAHIGHRFNLDGDERFDLDFEDDVYDEYNDRVPYLAQHDELLVPLWRSLTNALGDAPGDFMSSLSLCGTQLSGEVYDMLSLLHNKPVVRMAFNGLGLGREGLSFVAAHVERNPHLRELGLQNNPIDDLDIAARLFAAVKRHRELRKINLWHCGVDNELLRIIMDGSQNLTFLDLQDNEIGSEGAEYIANALTKNPPLERLPLNSNYICNDGISAMARALASNNNLSSLNVGSNDFTGAGRAALLRAVYNTSSLNAIKDSNHNICCIDCWSEEDPTGLPGQLCKRLTQANYDTDQRSFVRYDTKVRIKSKLLFALGAYFDQGPINIQYLSDVPLELMPRVLSFVQMTDIVPEAAQKIVLGKRIARETPLRNVFELAKHCLVPLLFVPKSSGHKRARLEVGGSREEATGDGERPTLTHEARLLPNRIAIDGKLSQQQCHAACELLDEFLNECRLRQDKPYMPLINNPKMRKGASEWLYREQYDRIYSLAGLLRERLGDRIDNNGVAELLPCSGTIYEANNDDSRKSRLRQDMKKLCSLLNQSPCQLGTTASKREEGE